MDPLNAALKLEDTDYQDDSQVLQQDERRYSNLNHRDALNAGLKLMERDCLMEADQVLTTSTMLWPHDAELWMAAGICSLKRGTFRKAVAALKMSVWLSGDPAARELLEASLVYSTSLSSCLSNKCSPRL